MERWWCLDCRAEVELNRSGRCSCCDSEAVDTMLRDDKGAKLSVMNTAAFRERLRPITPLTELTPVRVPAPAGLSTLLRVLSHFGNPFSAATSEPSNLN